MNLRTRFFFCTTIAAIMFMVMLVYLDKLRRDRISRKFHKFQPQSDIQLQNYLRNHPELLQGFYDNGHLDTLPKEALPLIANYMEYSSSLSSSEEYNYRNAKYPQYYSPSSESSSSSSEERHFLLAKFEYIPPPDYMNGALEAIAPLRRSGVSSSQSSSSNYRPPRRITEAIKYPSKSSQRTNKDVLASWQNSLSEEYNSGVSLVDLRPPQRRHDKLKTKWSSSSSEESSSSSRESSSYSDEVKIEFEIDNYFENRKAFDLSVLGRYLLANEPPPNQRPEQFKILMWKHGEYMEERHLYYFQKERHDPFANCSVNNCVLEYSDSSVADADAVMVLLHRLDGVDSLPMGPRPPSQRWIFLSDESPHHTFTLGSGDWQDLEGIFNWSMTYRAESDIPVPYGRVVPLQDTRNWPSTLDFQSQFKALVPNAQLKRRDVLVAVMISNCEASNERMEYIKELQQYIDVDFYGKCGSPDLQDACPGHYGEDCPALDQYLFFLAFENSNCAQYITEKAYAHGYQKGAVPIVMGSNNEVNQILLPPNSYINVDRLENPMELAGVLLYINNTLEENYLYFHEWRKHLSVVNEHGYMNSPSYHYCRVCEALNYNDQAQKVYGYEDLKYFLDSTTNCQGFIELT